MNTGQSTYSPGDQPSLHLHGSNDDVIEEESDTTPLVVRGGGLQQPVLPSSTRVVADVNPFTTPSNAASALEYAGRRRETRTFTVPGTRRTSEHSAPWPYPSFPFHTPYPTFVQNQSIHTGTPSLFHESAESAAAAAFSANYLQASSPSGGGGGSSSILPQGRPTSYFGPPTIHVIDSSDVSQDQSTPAPSLTGNGGVDSQRVASASPFVHPYLVHRSSEGGEPSLPSPLPHPSHWNGMSGNGHHHHPEDVVYENTSSIDFEALADRLTNNPPAMPKQAFSYPTFSSSSLSPPRLGLAFFSEPRYSLYSEAFGSLYADCLEGFDFSKCDMSLPLVETLERIPFWLDITAPTHEELLTLRKIFGIHPLTAEDLGTEETREKCEIMFHHYFFVVFRSFDHDRLSWSFMAPVNFYLIVFKECILTVHAKPLPHPANVHRRIHQLKAAFSLSITPDWINYALIDDITDSFWPRLRSIEGEVEVIDDLVLILKESEQSDMLRRIGQSRKRVTQMMRLLGTKSDVLRSIINRISDRLSLGSDIKLYLADIQDHIITMYQNVQHYEKTLGRAHSNYLAQISIEITQASNRTNDVVLKMTLIASVLVPLNIITGLWGMNVEVPGQEDKSLIWFFGIVCGMAILVVVTVWLVRKARII